MIEYFFPMIPTKFIVPYFLILLQILSYDFYFPAKVLYGTFVFEHICTSKFCYTIFACIYFAYGFVFKQII